MKYSFVIYTDDKQDFVIFIESEISKNWDPQFPVNQASELEKQGYEQTGSDGVFKLPKTVSKHHCYKALIKKGYKQDKILTKSLKKEFPEYTIFYPK